MPESGLRRTSELDPEVEHQIVSTRDRVRRGLLLLPRDRLVSFALAGGFLAAELLFLAFTHTTRHPSAWTVALYVGLYGLLSRVGFGIGVGFAIPVQLVLVPMLFVLPLSWVPLCVAAGYLLRDPVGLLTGKLTPSRAS